MRSMSPCMITIPRLPLDEVQNPALIRLDATRVYYTSSADDTRHR